MYTIDICGFRELIKMFDIAMVYLYSIESFSPLAHVTHKI